MGITSIIVKSLKLGNNWKEIINCKQFIIGVSLIWGGRCRGAIISPGGTKALTYAWGLGIASNNLAEAYALMQGLKLAIEANIRSLIVKGNSKLVIIKMVFPRLLLLIILLMKYSTKLKKRPLTSLVSASSMCFGRTIKLQIILQTKPPFYKRGLLASMETKIINPFLSINEA